MKLLPAITPVFDFVKIKQINNTISRKIYSTGLLSNASLYFKKPKMRVRIYVLTGIVGMFFFSCVKGGKCEQAQNIFQSEVVIVFKDKNSGKYLYAEVNPLYDKDSLSVFAPNGESLTLLNHLRSAPDNPQEGIYFISFGPLYNEQTDKESFTAELCKEYIVKYSYNETAKLKLCFKSEKTSCGSSFVTLKVYDGIGNVLGSVENETYVQITVNKN